MGKSQAQCSNTRGVLLLSYRALLWYSPHRSHLVVEGTHLSCPQPPFFTLQVSPSSFSCFSDVRTDDCRKPKTSGAAACRSLSVSRKHLRLLQTLKAQAIPADLFLPPSFEFLTYDYCFCFFFNLFKNPTFYT